MIVGRDVITARIVSSAIQTTHLLHKGKTNDEYEKMRQVYIPVLQRIQDFFVNYCIGKDYEVINEDVQEELTRAKACTSDTKIVFHSEDELWEMRAYVYKCPYPASIDEMEQFFTELATGKLAFLRQYPLYETCGITLLDYVTPFLKK